jgi:putative transposase
MIFRTDYIYHIYNQGNNKGKIFFNRENYLFFLKKIRDHIVPFADILAWCLMPNHFHLMVLVKHIEMPIIEGLTQSETLNEGSIKDSGGFTRSEALTNRFRNLNDSVGLMLRSYTRAINKQNHTSGSLFRKNTKAECINCPEPVALSFISRGTGVEILPQETYQYPQVCFDYIHYNPVKAGLVDDPTDWEFSSARDYAGLRNGKLISRETAKEYGLKYY